MTATALPALAPRRRRVPLTVGAAIVAALLVVALVSLVWTPFPVAGGDPGAALQGPGGGHWLGTDAFGRDLLSLTMKGLLPTLLVPLAALIAAALIALPAGILTSRFGANRRSAMRVSSAALLPSALLIGLLLATIMGPSELVAAIAIAVASVVPLASATRAALRSVRGRAYLDAARLAGLSPWETLRAHALPEIATVIAAASCRLMSAGIAAEATIAFLGIGAQPAAASIGLLLHDAPGYASANPWPEIALGLVLVAAIVAFRLIAAGLRATTSGPDGPA